MIVPVEPAGRARSRSALERWGQHAPLVLQDLDKAPRVQQLHAAAGRPAEVTRDSVGLGAIGEHAPYTHAEPTQWRRPRVAIRGPGSRGSGANVGVPSKGRADRREA